MPDAAHDYHPAVVMNFGESLPDEAATRSVRIPLRGFSRCGISLVWDDTLTGALTLWSSESPDPDPDDDLDWHQVNDIAFEAEPNASSIGTRLSLYDIGHRYIRIKYAHTSGVGAILGRVTLKR